MKHLLKKTPKALSNPLRALSNPLRALNNPLRALNNPLRALNNPLRALLLSALCLGLSGCEDPQIYGSVGFSSYGGGGYYGGRGMGTSIGIGGRIY